MALVCASAAGAAPKRIHWLGLEEDVQLKHYLAKYTIIDGDHEHVGWLLVIAANDEQAWSFADSLNHDTDCRNDGGSDKHPWSYGDGATACKLRLVREVTVEQFTVVRDVLGLMIYDAEPVHAQAG